MRLNPFGIGPGRDSSPCHTVVLQSERRNCLVFNPALGRDVGKTSRCYCDVARRLCSHYRSVALKDPLPSSHGTFKVGRDGTSKCIRHTQVIVADQQPDSNRRRYVIELEKAHPRCISTPKEE